MGASCHPETHPVNVYLDLIRESIYEINEGFGITAKEFVTFRKNGLKDRFSYNFLIGTLEIGNHVIYSEVYHTINIEEVLGVVTVQDRLYGQGTASQINKLLGALSDVLLKLQENRDYYSAKENSINTYVRDMLEQNGYTCSDQTLRAVSGSGKSAGSLDILIRDKESGKDLSIYEAQKLKGFGKTEQNYLDDHLKRLLDNYNAKGFRNLLLVSYVAWDKMEFNELTDQYITYVSRGDSAPYKIVESRVINYFEDTYLRSLKVGYNCGGTTMYVYHIIVRVAA